MVAALLSDLRRRDIRVWAEGDRLRCRAPTGALTPALRHELQVHKGEILEFLRSAAALAEQPRAIVPLQPTGARAPIFGVPGHNGDVFCYRDFLRHMDRNRPFFGLQPPGLDGASAPLDRVEDLATYYAKQIRAFRPAGPYIITGFCAGGGIAVELAHQLLASGASIEFVGLFGSPYPTWYGQRAQFAWRLGRQRERLRTHLEALNALSLGELRHYVFKKLEDRRILRAERRAALTDPVLARRAEVEHVTIRALRFYRPRPLAAHLCLFTPAPDWLPEAAVQWRAIARSAEEHVGPDGCSGDTMLREHAAVFATLFHRSIDTLEARASHGAAPARQAV